MRKRPPEVSGKAVLWYVQAMQIRPASASDVKALLALDGHIESARYLHLETSGGGLQPQWRLEERALRARHVDVNPMCTAAKGLLERLTRGADEGVALVADYNQAPIALLIARERLDAQTLEVCDLRIDPGFRRQGIGTALLYRAIGVARERGLRAAAAEAPANNFPACRLLAACGFVLSGVDGRRHTNHDVVREAATLLFYAPLD
jgi:ribosomal protein S18 acetylase RimI-like enzyme